MRQDQIEFARCLIEFRALEDDASYEWLAKLNKQKSIVITGEEYIEPDKLRELAAAHIDYERTRKRSPWDPKVERLRSYIDTAYYDLEPFLTDSINDSYTDLIEELSRDDRLGAEDRTFLSVEFGGLWVRAVRVITTLSSYHCGT